MGKEFVNDLTNYWTSFYGLNVCCLLIYEPEVLSILESEEDFGTERHFVMTGARVSASPDMGSTRDVDSGNH